MYGKWTFFKQLHNLQREIYPGKVYVHWLFAGRRISRFSVFNKQSGYCFCLVGWAGNRFAPYTRPPSGSVLFEDINRFMAKVKFHGKGQSSMVVISASLAPGSWWPLRGGGGGEGGGVGGGGSLGILWCGTPHLRRNEVSGADSRRTRVRFFSWSPFFFTSCGLGALSNGGSHY